MNGNSPLSSNGEDTNFILLTGLWVVVALALYFMRPNPARLEEEPIKKLPPGGSGNSGSDVCTLIYLIYNLLNINLTNIYDIICVLGSTPSSSYNGSSVIFFTNTFYKIFELAQFKIPFYSTDNHNNHIELKI